MLKRRGEAHARLKMKILINLARQLQISDTYM
jgi:hypothetical protein